MDKLDVESLLVDVLRSRLSLKVSSRQIYTPFSKEALYTEEKTIQLVLDGYEVISEVDLDD
jgi:hypothetical protein